MKNVRTLAAIALIFISGGSLCLAEPLGLPSKPAPCPERWLGLLGKYGRPNDGKSDFLVREEGGRLQIYGSRPNDLQETGRDSFLEVVSGKMFVFVRDSLGGGGACLIGEELYARKFYPGERDSPRPPTWYIPLDSLWAEAKKARPPVEKGRFAKPDLVDVRHYDPGIKLDLAYSNPKNSYGFALYDKEAAYLQRPAARALARANASLKPLGFTIQLSDAYRPWYVTKFIRMAARPSEKQFYANPAKGSHHNRGTAVDATLVDIQTGIEVDMGYGQNEFSERAAAWFPGGTSLQRWHRLVLRTALERQGFRGLSKEWWHYRFISRKRYPIINRPLSRVVQ